MLTSDLRALASELIRTKATGVIVAHNHPDGPALFSDADLFAAEEILTVLRSFRIRNVKQVLFGKCGRTVLSDPRLFPDGEE